jgi:hypothetical protein
MHRGVYFGNSELRFVGYLNSKLRQSKLTSPNTKSFKISVEKYLPKGILLSCIFGSENSSFINM